MHAPGKIGLMATMATMVMGCGTLHRDGVAAPENGGVVAVRNGAALVVSLSPDPSTGYGWVLTGSSPNLWVVGGPDYMQDPKPPGMLGVSGATIYRFRARGPGPATLEFAWQTAPGQPALPAKVVRYNVTVTPAKVFEF